MAGKKSVCSDQLFFFIFCLPIHKVYFLQVTDSAWDPDRAPELETMLAVIKRNFTLGVLIEEWVGPDDRNSQNHIIQIGMYWEAGRALEGLPAKID